MLQHPNNDWKKKWYVIIFQHHTKEGRLFDLVLLWLILLSVVAVIVDSSAFIHDKYQVILFGLEWLITIAFSIEYVIRIIVSPVKRNYILSFYGIIDLLAIIPTYLSLFVTGSQLLIVIRVLRLLRVFRIFKLSSFTSAGLFLMQALKNSREKIVVFFGAVLLLVTIVGTIMYLVEGPQSGFDSIPVSIYWAIVTITTVGYGDISPATSLGQFIASVLMLTGYAIIAVPTGILSSEFNIAKKKQNSGPGKARCKACSYGLIGEHYNFCPHCGVSLNGTEHKPIKYQNLTKDKPE